MYRPTKEMRVDLHAEHHMAAMERASQLLLNRVGRGAFCHEEVFLPLLRQVAPLGCEDGVRSFGA
eukprot:2128327-Prorocentrum_lima.AAC.1